MWDLHISDPREFSVCRIEFRMRMAIPKHNLDIKKVNVKKNLGKVI